MGLLGAPAVQAPLVDIVLVVLYSKASPVRRRHDQPSDPLRPAAVDQALLHMEGRTSSIGDRARLLHQRVIGVRALAGEGEDRGYAIAAIASVLFIIVLFRLTARRERGGMDCPTV